MPPEDLGFTREELLSAVERMQVAVIGFSLRGGSMFLQGLFAQYKEIATTPTMSSVYDFYQDEHALILPETYIEFFEKNGPCLEDEELEADPVAKERYFSCSYKTFFSLCRMYGPCQRKEYFLLLHIAFALADGKSLEKLTCVLFHLHSPMSCVMKIGQEQPVPSTNQIEKIMQDFPHARIIVTLRNPVCGLESYALYDENHGEFLRCFALMLCAVFYICRLWRPERSIFLLTLPDLHRNFNTVMGALCAFLDVPFDPSLRSSRFYGAIPHPDYSAKQKIANQPNPTFIDWKGNVLSKNQISAIKFFFHDFYKKFFPENKQEGQLSFADFGRTLLWITYAAGSIRSIHDAYYLKELFKKYCALKRFRHLNIENAWTYERKGNASHSSP
ncbi:MAG: sulfotransferase [Holosporales bacterium]|nr:sulfotransferase [Holosporales bacterium]